MSNNKEIKLSSTVILYRDSDQGPQFLLAKKSEQLAFLPGYWVFPGGAVDPDDEQDTPLNTLKEAAVREISEEINTNIADLPLTLFAHWVTPEGSPKRFSTYFFLAQLPQASMKAVQVDGGELVESRWLTASEGIKQHKQGLAPMLPPTLVSLMKLQGFSSAQAISSTDWSNSVTTIEPKAAYFHNKLVMLYPGDAAYGLAHDTAGERHRCTEEAGIWTYINTINSELLLAPV